jgi:hypothetical protein
MQRLCSENAILCVAGLLDASEGLEVYEISLIC